MGPSMYVLFRIPPLRVYGKYTRSVYINFRGEAEEGYICILTEGILHKPFVVVF